MVTKRLLLLLAMGLGALYLIHILAGDYQKIRKPAAKLARLLVSKRDVSAALEPHPPEVGRPIMHYEFIACSILRPISCDRARATTTKHRSSYSMKFNIKITIVGRHNSPCS